MEITEQIQNRRAIEAMRSGVPNQDVVRIMGCSQDKLERTFIKQLEEVRVDFVSGLQSPGMLLAGDFGSGKSHLLEYLQHLALERNFVCSKFVISKETPLYDKSKLYQAAVKSAVAPGKIGIVLTEIANSLNFHDPDYGEFFKWLNQPGIEICSWFAATVYLYEQLKGDEEVRDRIIRFWSGDKLSISELKSWLRRAVEPAIYKLDKITAKELARQRFHFASRLMIAAGYSGWVLLIDEVELIGRYSRMQRARSYAQIAGLLGKVSATRVPGLTSVMAITGDYEAAVLDDKMDEEKIPGKLKASDDADHLVLCRQAEKGMGLIRKKIVVQKPDSDMINSTFVKLRIAYQKAYGWLPPAEIIGPDLKAPMRQHVKRGITIWDLRRLYPDYVPYMVTVPMKINYQEESGLGGENEDAANNS
jgi:hypothetical protein